MNQYPWLDEYLLDKPGVQKDYKAEWGWMRYRIGEKLYAATCCPGPEHREYGGHELVTLKCDPRRSELLRAEFSDILPGFYSNKQHWISVFLDGTVPEDVLRDLCDASYELVRRTLPKKVQRALEES